MQSTLLRKAPGWLVLPLAVLVTGLGAWQGWMLWQRSAEPRDLPASTTSGVQPVEQRSVTELVPLHLFGQPRQEPAVVEQSTEDLPETNLRLTLRGVAATTAEETGGALIEGPDRETNFFRIGERMPGDVRLHAVFPNRVVLDRQGKLENLLFPEAFEEGTFVTVYEAPSADTGGETFYEEPQYPEPEYIEPVYPTNESGEPVINEAPPATEFPPTGEAAMSAVDPAIQAMPEPEPYVEEPPMEEPEPIVYQEEYEPAPDPEPVYEAPAASDDGNSAMDALEEQRKQEIRERLQRLREQIRQRSQS